MNLLNTLHQINKIQFTFHHLISPRQYTSAEKQVPSKWGPIRNPPPSPVTIESDLANCSLPLLCITMGHVHVLQNIQIISLSHLLFSLSLLSLNFSLSVYNSIETLGFWSTWTPQISEFELRFTRSISRKNAVGVRSPIDHVRGRREGERVWLRP